MEGNTHRRYAASLPPKHARKFARPCKKCFPEDAREWMEGRW